MASGAVHQSTLASAMPEDAALSAVTALEGAPPPAPTIQQQQQLQQRPAGKVSRYRSLRGKSVSSVRRDNSYRPFDVYKDHDSHHGYDSDNTWTSRARSKSATWKGADAYNAHQLKDPEHDLQMQRELQELQQARSGPLHLLPTTNTNSPLCPKPLNLPLRTSQSVAAVGNKPFKTAAPARIKQIDTEPSHLRKEVPQSQPGPGEAERKRREEAKQAAVWAEEVARLEAETDRILAEQKKRDLARLQAQLAATPTPTASPKSKPKRLILDKLGIFSRSHKTNVPGQPSTPKSAPARTFAFNWSPVSLAFDRSSPPSPDPMTYIEYGGGGVVPQIDAPTSASNGGERRVTVTYLSSTINLPVTTSTTPIDIVYSTADLTTHKINPATSVVMECYVVLGLQRRLRRHERVRDVMNSWDRDQQNSLLILSYGTSQDNLNFDSDLELESVPRTENPPLGFTFQLYHSSRPGKWNKRWVTLMDSGQMFTAKHPDSSATDKDSTVLCHMSDFDIYTPKESEMKRHLKPPKRFCYAVKSQQKTTLFPNGDNFVHFFSTEDENLAQRFHELVHGWRSWYLANKQIDFEDKVQESPSVRRSGTRVKKSTSVSAHLRRERTSTDKASYKIGEFKPLINMEQFNKPLEEFGKDSMNSRTSNDGQNRERPQPKLLTKSRTQPVAPTQPLGHESEFLAGGLLGDTYEKRKQAEASTVAAKKEDGPFTEGPSLLNNLTTSPTSPDVKAEPLSWFPSAVEHTARTRSRSRPAARPMTADASRREKQQQQQQQSLVGGNYDFPQPPRARSGGRPAVGHGVKPPAGAPLINFATSGPSLNQGLPSRSNSMASSVGGAGSHGSRPRSRSTASRSGAHRYMMEDQPPVPPLPSRSVRRPGGRTPSEPSRGRDTRPQEPLINRAK